MEEPALFHHKAPNTSIEIITEIFSLDVTVES